MLTREISTLCVYVYAIFKIQQTVRQHHTHCLWPAYLFWLFAASLVSVSILTIIYLYMLRMFMKSLTVVIYGSLYILEILLYSPLRKKKKVVMKLTLQTFDSKRNLTWFTPSCFWSPSYPWSFLGIEQANIGRNLVYSLT